MAKQKTSGPTERLFQDEPVAAKALEVNLQPPKMPEGQAPKPSTRDERQEFFLPVSGFVWLFPEEVAVVDHPAFQRLGKIYQLGQTYLVYRGATHRRMEHVLGAVHIVQRMIEAVSHNSEKAQSRGVPSGKSLSDAEVRFTRLGALLHDIGHVSAGHTLEDELGIIGKHDEDGRLNLIFEGAEWVDDQHRTLGQLINEQFAQYVPQGLKDEGVTPAEIVRLIIRKRPKVEEDDQFLLAQEKLAASAEIRMAVCCYMVGNTICADLLDYLHRDWYHIGKPRPFDERILQYMEVRSVKGLPTAAPTDAFVISLGRRPKIRTDAVSAILELLEWRYQLAESVLFHRTKLAATAMLDRALFDLWGKANREDIEKTVLPLGDDELISEALHLSTVGKKGVAESLLRALQRRQLYTGLSTFAHDDLPADVRTRVQTAFAQPEGRNAVLSLLEADFRLEPGSLAMYCPHTAAMNAKIARVQIAIGEQIAHFDDYERDYENQLSGGHLEAQLHRFRRLWRAHFFINREAMNGLSSEMLHALRQAVEKLALGNTHEESSLQAARGIASLLTAIGTSPWKGSSVTSDARAAAYQDSSRAFGSYPFGALSIRSYLEQ
jgi:HD superfamily phosphohydrolase